MREFKITESQVINLLNYLKNKPYIEVFHIIGEIQALQVLEEQVLEGKEE